MSATLCRSTWNRCQINGQLPKFTNLDKSGCQIKGRLPIASLWSRRQINDRPMFANLDEIDVYYFTFQNPNVKLWGLNTTVWNHVNLPCTCSNFEGYKDPKNILYFEAHFVSLPNPLLNPKFVPKVQASGFKPKTQVRGHSSTSTGS